MGNVSSISNKMDELAELIQHQREKHHVIHGDMANQANTRYKHHIGRISPSALLLLIMILYSYILMVIFFHYTVSCLLLQLGKFPLLWEESQCILSCLV